MYQFKIQGDGDVEVAHSAKVSPDVQFVFHAPSRVIIGDYCVIGQGTKFVCTGGDVFIGDWSTLHDNCLVLAGKGVTIGAHCWFGQNTVIDGSGGMVIGRGVRVGMYSQLWSHVAAGEQIEGCTLFGDRPVIIEDDVWLVGSCIVASGVTIGRRSVALIGSNITKTCDANTVLAGSPAAVKANLSFYREITLTEKWELLESWLPPIAASVGVNLIKDNNCSILLECSDDSNQSGKIVFVKEAVAANIMRAQQKNTTICCVEDKSYNKRLSLIEQKTLKALAGNKARFYAIS